jgi:hypothetical protein
MPLLKFKLTTKYTPKYWYRFFSLYIKSGKGKCLLKQDISFSCLPFCRIATQSSSICCIHFSFFPVFSYKIYDNYLMTEDKKTILLR